jgi:hypothetical protein
MRVYLKRDLSREKVRQGESVVWWINYAWMFDVVCWQAGKHLGQLYAELVVQIALLEASRWLKYSGQQSE